MAIVGATLSMIVNDVAKKILAEDRKMITDIQAQERLMGELRRNIEFQKRMSEYRAALGQ
ncbi:hypothetical protein QMK19_02725 [Streptomyces sp. H10-C2]|uniref:hypothetical protein n=1 Tax=unclassified Streptomyces TaxID=2593676 RepID=UPI0024B98BFE|nr:MULTISPECIES: hypothetical protein [unclassified Streptomyces]MDJ0344079.1 hypothetical protein [Streptomyces sp. PH10-H1]MDJ0368618.1 hypothetical protein [Streptomyces sp. H10-C2]